MLSTGTDPRRYEHTELDRSMPIAHNSLVNHLGTLNKPVPE